MTVPFVALLALLLASGAALCATERAATRITGARGWFLFLLLTLGATLLLQKQVGDMEAWAIATVVLMTTLPCMAALLGWQRRQEARHGRH